MALCLLKTEEWIEARNICSKVIHKFIKLLSIFSPFYLFFILQQENIVKKANQKRLLGDLAIEGGNFTTAFFKKSTIKDLFDTNTESNETVAEVTELPDEETTNSLETISKKATKAFEKAIATVEDNTDLIVCWLFVFNFAQQI